MSLSEPTAIAVAVRGLVRSTDTTRPPELTDVLRRRVEHLLFEAALLAPPNAVVERAIATLTADSELLGLDDVSLVAEWDALAEAEALKFAHGPDRWGDPTTAAYVASCADVFGIDEGRVPLLIQHFHSLSRGARYGVFLAIERSESFSYLQREIDAAPADTPLEEPNTSFRALIQRVFRDA